MAAKGIRSSMSIHPTCEGHRRVLSLFPFERRQMMRRMARGSTLPVRPQPMSGKLGRRCRRSKTIVASLRHLRRIAGETTGDFRGRRECVALHQWCLCVLTINIVIIVGRCLPLDCVAMRALTVAFAAAKREGDRRDRIAELMWLTYKVGIGALGRVNGDKISSLAPPPL
jgi:hypothetical protein